MPLHLLQDLWCVLTAVSLSLAAYNHIMTTQTIGKYRWVIATLLLFSTTINYMDRQVISYLKEFFCTPIAKGGFGWTNSDYSNVTGYFTLFYAGMTVFAGWFIDKIGTKLGLALSLIVW